MKERLSRLWAIVRTDFLVRFRRPSTAVIFLLLCITAYLWIPHPSTGRALLQFNEQRALYNSPALAMATALLCSILLALIGFYMVSSTIRRDVESRTGFIIASTTVRTWEYLTGKILGNIVFLSAIVLGFLLSCMVMQLVRGEADLEPLVFLHQYGLLVPPVIVFVAVVAAVFESVRFLSGRFGDLAYFCVWAALVAIQATATDSKEPAEWTKYVDTLGFRFMLEQLQTISHEKGISIGSSEYNMARPPFVFHGLVLRNSAVLPRISSLLYPIPLFLIAWFCFHRFNPVKLKGSYGKGKRNLLLLINSKLRPITVPFFALFSKLQRHSQGPSFLSSTITEAALTLKIYPAALLGMLIFAFLSLIAGTQKLQQGILPFLFLGLVILIADASTRDKRTGTMAMMFSMPQLKTNYVWWKFASVLLLILGFTLVPAARVLASDPSAGVSILIGSLFLAACATSFGVMTANPKTFIVLFLLFWYLALNDRGNTPGFDFAGWYGKATTLVQLAYLSVAALMLLSAQTLMRWQQKRT